MLGRHRSDAGRKKGEVDRPWPGFTCSSPSLCCISIDYESVLLCVYCNLPRLLLCMNVLPFTASSSLCFAAWHIFILTFVQNTVHSV